jgi:UDP-glucose 4-epimerase
MAKKQTAIVTGGAGFIGSQLAERLLKEGLKVVIIDDLSSGRKEFVPKRATFVRMSVNDPKLVKVFEREKPAYVFHLAAQIDVRLSVEQPLRDAETNIHGSLRVLEASARTGVKKIIFSSSGGAIYHGLDIRPTPENVPCMPLSPYGVAKFAFELYLHSACHNYGIKYVALRYANVYGPRQDSKGEAGVIGIFIRKMMAGQPPTVFGDGEQTRDFVFVDDVVEANVRAMRSPHRGAYNIGTGKETSVNRIVGLLKKEFPGVTPLHGPANPGEERRSSLDCRAARRAFGWTPKVNIAEGIKRTAAWFRKSRA